MDAHFLEFPRDEGAGADEGDFCAEFQQGGDVRTGYAGEKDIANDGDMKAGDASETLADGEDIEERLGGMLVGAVAGVDDARGQALAEEEGSAGARVAQDDDIGVEGLEVAGGILEGLAFREARGAGGDVYDIGAQAECCELEGCAGAGARLYEEVDEGFAAEGGNFFDFPRADLLEGGGGVENEEDFRRGRDRGWR